jgi:hypothetical protein
MQKSEKFSPERKKFTLKISREDKIGMSSKKVEKKRKFLSITRKKNYFISQVVTLTIVQRWRRK